MCSSANSPSMPNHSFIKPPFLPSILEEELLKYEWASKLDFARLRATDSTVYEVSDGHDLFSQTLWNICFPCVETSALWHYTSIKALHNILAQQEVRLHSVEKRMGEGDMTAFAGTFGLSGYLMLRDDGTRLIDDLARDMFYLSLTLDDNPGTRWNSFGPVRLRLKVEPICQRAELRRIAYSTTSDATTHPFKVIQRVVQDRFDRSFVPSRISRAGAFYLPFHFEDEAEVRLLIKKFGADDPTEVRTGSTGPHVAVPLKLQHQRVRITLLEIELKDLRQLSEVAGLERLVSEAGVHARQYIE